MWTRRTFLQVATTVGLGAVYGAVAGANSKSEREFTHRELVELRRARQTTFPLQGAREYRGVLHAHTALSHDSHGTIEEVLAAARSASLDFLVTTDHYTRRIFTEGVQGQRESVCVIRGVEIPLGCTQGQGVGRRCGSVLAIGLREPLNPSDYENRKDLFAAIKAQGALAILAHTRGVADPLYFDLADGLEIYDLADTMRDRLVDIPADLVNFALSSGKSQDDYFMPLINRPDWHLAQWDLVTQNRRYVGVAGNDAHQNLSFLGRRIDPYDRVFHVLNTHVIATDLSMAGLIEAIGAGRCFVSFNLLSDAFGFRYVVRDGADGNVLGMLGDELIHQEGLVLHIETPLPAVIELLRNGMPIRRQHGRRLLYDVHRPGVYRVEVSLRVADRARPWILANPIYIR